MGLVASLARAVWTLAVLDELVETNVAADVPVPRSGKKRPQQVVWSAEQARTFLDITADTRWSPVWRLWLTTGARRGEVLGLRWSDLDSGAGLLTIERTLHKVDYKGVPSLGEPKTTAGRRVLRLDPVTVAALDRWRGRQAVEVSRVVEPMFTPAGRVWHVNPQWVSAVFRNEVERAGLPPMRSHGIRHTAASLLVSEGVPLPAVAQRLGHSSAAVSLGLYSHALPGQDDAVAGLLGGLLDEAPGQDQVAR